MFTSTHDVPSIVLYRSFPTSPVAFATTVHPRLPSTMTTADPFPFPHPELMPIHSKPTGPTVTKLLTQVFANAIAVPSTIGGGNHGHLGAIVPAAEYLTISNQLIAFNAPG